MNNVIVTGASGFVGNNLVPYLQSRALQVMPVSRTAGFSYTDIDPHYLDSNHISAIVHLAGKAHDLAKTTHPEDYYKANSDITISLFEAFVRSEVEVFIYMSSVKAAADQVTGLLTENIEARPATDYGKSKLAAEKHILSVALPRDKRVYILRPCMIHGPGNKGNLNLLYQVVSKGLPYPLAAFDNRRSFLSVKNLCFVIFELLTRKDIDSGIYNVSDNGALSTNSIVRLMADVLHTSPRLLAVPPAIIRFIAWVGNWLPIPLNTERLRKLTENYVVSNKKLNIALHKQLPVEAEAGLKETLLSFAHAD